MKVMRWIVYVSFFAGFVGYFSLGTAAPAKMCSAEEIALNSKGAELKQNAAMATQLGQQLMLEERSVNEQIKTCKANGATNCVNPGTWSKVRDLKTHLAIYQQRANKLMGEYEQLYSRQVVCQRDGVH
jgi:hypothetical protein